MVERLLEVLPSVVRKVGDQLEIDADCCEMLKWCLEHFDEVTIACPFTTNVSGLRNCRPVKDLPWHSRIRLVELPNAYDLGGFIRSYRLGRRILRVEIENADFLLFSPHTLVGDWPTIGIREAIKMKRPYAMEADVVYHNVAQIHWAHDPAWKRFIKKDILLPLFYLSYRYCLKHSRVGLFQGQDCYEAYSNFTRNPQKISSNIPIYKEDHISEEQLQNKLSSLDQRRPLKLCYVGRAIDMKGPMDWLQTVDKLIRRDVSLKAIWLGDGDLLPSMRSMAQKLGIANAVSLPGYVSEQEKMATLKESHIFLFCHKTREAPRCLGEALASGCPLVGYGSAFAKDLVAESGGGQFATVGDWQGLAEIVQKLDQNRDKLRDLIRAASTWGQRYDRDAQLERRSALIRGNLAA